ncbi:MAG: efflux RND transporter periplasmic adaptor subunit [Cyanobacteria bacterium J06598_1]
MTASSDSSPTSLPSNLNSAPSVEVSPVEVSDRQTTSAPISLGNDRPRRSWWGVFAALLLAGGLGFIVWRTFIRSGGPAMQGPPPSPVEMERLQEKSLENSAEFVGTLDSQAGVSLQPEADGRVVQIFVSSGDFVAAGDPVMQLSPQRSQSDYNAALASISAARSSRDGASAQLRAAEARKTELLADLELQETDFGRTATLVERGALAQEELDEVRRDRTVAESALSSALEEISALEASLAGAEATLEQANANASATQQDLLDKTVTAPIAGIVGNIPIKLGDYVQAGDQLATVTQNEDLDVEVAVPINQADQLKVGLPVELSLFGADEAIATGNIRFVSPTTDPNTQTVLAKARFSTPESPLQNDQRLEVRIIWDERPGILIPTTAISRLGGETFVFVPGEPDPPAEGEGPPPGSGGNGQGVQEGPPPMVARLKPVKLGKLQGNEYQVLEGLNPGDTVITSGLLNLRDGVPIAQQEAGEAAGGAEADSTEAGADGSSE